MNNEEIEISEEEIKNCVPSYEFAKIFLPEEEFQKFRMEVIGIIRIVRNLGNRNSIKIQ